MILGILKNNNTMRLREYLLSCREYLLSRSESLPQDNGPADPPRRRSLLVAAAAATVPSAVPAAAAPCGGVCEDGGT